MIPLAAGETISAKKSASYTVRLERDSMSEANATNNEVTRTLICPE